MSRRLALHWSGKRLEAEVEAALADATRALATGDDEAFAEQQRLHGARDEIKERLALLAGSE